MSETRGGHRSDAPQLTAYARSRRAGNLVFLAGVSSRQPDNSVKGAFRGPTGAVEFDIRAQTEGCIENLRAALETEGLRLADVVDASAFLVNMTDYAGFHQATIRRVVDRKEGDQSWE